ncbi:conserved Plasmodium protein, unknown function [Plasmodium ovale curtisi]|uniref:Uncharacterized protein n=1 Tax=Plasmodium ovale curtisi TaxID=864141 RepID=A0A1A8W6E9_PLAOA|nr:conserved Plasmodium protein, unknown function [Plasmodium ovale curtisi]
MEHGVVLQKNDSLGNANQFCNEELSTYEDAKNSDMFTESGLFSSFYVKFMEIFTFVKDTKENKNNLQDEVDENLIMTLFNLCQELLNGIKNINDFGNMHLSKNDQDLIIESYEKFVRKCKQYNDKPQVKQLENEISNLLDLLFNNTSEVVNTLFSADSFFIDHVENLKLKLTERNQKIEFEEERMKKLELEAKVEEYDDLFEKNKEKNSEMDETLATLKKDIDKLNEKIQKYDNYMKKKRKEIDINFSGTQDCKERIKLLEESIKTVERNMKTTQLSPLKIVEKTEEHIIFEFKVTTSGQIPWSHKHSSSCFLHGPQSFICPCICPFSSCSLSTFTCFCIYFTLLFSPGYPLFSQTIRNTVQFKVSHYQLPNTHVEMNPCESNILSYINGNIRKCKDISEIAYLIKEHRSHRTQTLKWEGLKSRLEEDTCSREKAKDTWLRFRGAYIVPITDEKIAVNFQNTSEKGKAGNHPTQRQPPLMHFFGEGGKNLSIFPE